MSEVVKTNVYKRVLLENSSVLDAIERQYGFVVDKIVRLHGFCDVTYHVIEGGKVRNEYIFKVFTDPYTQNINQIEAEIDLIQFLGKRGFPVPKLVLTKNDQCSFTKIAPNGEPYFARLQTFLKGKALCDFNITDAFVRNVGHLVGQIDAALAKYSHPFYESMIEIDFLVNYKQDEKLMVLLPFLENEEIVKLASRGFKIYEDKIAPNLKYLPIQQIHGDIDFVNMLADSERLDNKDLPALGVIDFTDSRKSCRLYDPAVAITSVLTFSDKSLATSHTKSFLDSYHAVSPLTNLELQLLRACVIGRLSNIVTLHEYSQLTDKHYDGYLLKYSGGGDVVYKLLQQLLDDEEQNKPFLP